MMSFRKFIAWDQALLKEALEDKVHAIVNSPGLSFLFSRDGIIYGGGESARVTFAKLKSRKKEDEIAGWKDDADFMAVKLLSVVNGDEPSHSVFTKKDLSNIKVLDPEEAKQKLLRSAKQNDLG